ncbi:MAG: hypothetical protein ACTHK2_04660 [Dokdonella sp.]|uniref:hypothetical protein n=1 Tax=Dokdonella sp. TaxID=2291710 RepID=UPI003F81603C
MSAAVEYVAETIAQALTRLERLFTPGAKLTFIARFDDNEEADVFVSADTTDKVLELVQRTLARERGERPSLAGAANGQGLTQQ